MNPALLYFVIEEEERIARETDPNWEPVFSLGTLCDCSWKDCVIGLLIGLSPFILSAIVITIICVIR